VCSVALGSGPGGGCCWPLAAKTRRCGCGMRSPVRRRVGRSPAGWRAGWNSAPAWAPGSVKCSPATLPLWIRLPLALARAARKSLSVPAPAGWTSHRAALGRARQRCLRHV